jgi:hypothetical protein
MEEGLPEMGIGATPQKHPGDEDAKTSTEPHLDSDAGGSEHAHRSTETSKRCSLTHTGPVMVFNRAILT